MRAANSHFGKHYINGVWTTPKGAMIVLVSGVVNWLDLHGKT